MLLTTANLEPSLFLKLRWTKLRIFYNIYIYIYSFFYLRKITNNLVFYKSVLGVFFFGLVQRNAVVTTEICISLILAETSLWYIHELIEQTLFLQLDMEFLLQMHYVWRIFSLLEHIIVITWMSWDIRGLSNSWKRTERKRKAQSSFTWRWNK